MSTIQVSLNTSANPPVTVNPNHLSVNNGNHKIKWARAAQQQFKFVGLTGLSGSPFSNLSISDTEISVDDNPPPTGDYPYTIVVSFNGTQYSTDGSLTGASGGTQARAAIAAPKPLVAGPIIQNR